VVKAAVGNLRSGKEVIALLFKQRQEGFKIINRLVAELARSFSAISIKLLLEY